LSAERWQVVALLIAKIRGFHENFLLRFGPQPPDTGILNMKKVVNLLVCNVVYQCQECDEPTDVLQPTIILSSIRTLGGLSPYRHKSSSSF
jgi:hypothetical protein